MKKLLFMLASLFLLVGSASAAQLVEDGIYTIEGGNTASSSDGHRGFLAAGEGYEEYPVLSDIKWTNYSGKSTTAIENGMRWYITSKNGGETYIIYNVGLKKFLNGSGNQVNFSDTPYEWEIVENTQNDYSYTSIKYVSFACGYTAAQRNVRYNWEAADGGSCHKLTAEESGLEDFADPVEDANHAILQGIIAEAQALVDAANVSEKIGDYSQDSVDALKAAIAVAKAVEACTDSDIQTLLTAIDAFLPITFSANNQYCIISAYQNFANLEGLYSDGTNPKWALLSNAANYIWTGEVTDNGVALKNVNDSKYIQGQANNNTAWVMTDAAEGNGVTVKVLTRSEGVMGYEYGFFLNGRQLHANGHGSGANSSGNIVSWENDNNSPSAWFIVEPSQVCKVKYAFVHGGETKYTQETYSVIGYKYPAITTSFPYGVTATVPSGVISAEEVIDGVVTKSVDLEISMPFKYADSYANVVWQYLTFDASNNYYLYYTEGQTCIDLDQKSVAAAQKDAYSWGFIGNPFDGFQIVNKAAGEGKILSSSTTMDKETDSETYPILTDVATLPEGNNQYWTPTQSTHAIHGFFLAQKGYASNRMNQRDSKLAYWTTGANAGSTFAALAIDVIEEGKSYVMRHDDSNYYFNMEKTGFGDSKGTMCASLVDTRDEASIVQFVKNSEVENQWQIVLKGDEGYNLSSNSDWNSIINATDDYLWNVSAYSDDEVYFTRTGTAPHTANALGTTSYASNRALWTNLNALSAGGCDWIVEEVTDAEALALKQAIFAAETRLNSAFKEDTPGFYKPDTEYYNTLSAATNEANAFYEDITGKSSDEIVAAKSALENAMIVPDSVSVNLAGPFNGVYTITCYDANRGYLCYVEQIEGGYVWSSGRSESNSTTVEIPAKDTDNSKWAFVEFNDEMLLFNVANKQFIRPTGTGAANAWTFYKDKAAAITLVTAAPGVGTVEINSTLDDVYYHMSISNGFETPVGGYYAADDGGVPMVFERVGDLDESLLTEMASMSPTTGIEEILAEGAQAGKVGIYDLQGRRLSAPVKGINIINGKKVLVK